MSTRRPQLRAFWLAFAALQLLLPGAASIADARLEAASIQERPTSHIEEHGGPNCARVHPADCAFCRVLSSSAPAPTAAAAAPFAVLCIAAPSDGTAHVARHVPHATRSRAPPPLA